VRNPAGAILVPEWNREKGSMMAVNLSIKNIPDALAARLRNHRSIQGELMVILEEALLARDRVTAKEILAQVRGLKIKTAAEAATLVRTDRDAR
jgi:plasmid stability protein